MGNKKCACRYFVGRSEGKRPLGRTRYRWEDNIKRVLKEFLWGSMNWIDLLQDRQVVGNCKWNNEPFFDSITRGEFTDSKTTVSASQEELHFIQLISLVG
jgi:hypothetical protein